jgi:cell division septation protein DedD
MSRDNDEDSDGENTTPPQDDIQARNESSRHASPFGGFNANDEYEYEEPDRDTDYASGYSTNNEEDIDGSDSNRLDDDEQGLLSFEEEDPDASGESDQHSAAESDDWLEDREHYNEGQKSRTQAWPLGLIAVAVVALMLLVAGGYGVMQERAAIEKELGELREILTTVANSEDASVSQRALQTLQQSYDKLSREAELLIRENRKLTDAAIALEARLEASKRTLATNNKAADAPGATETKPPTPSSTEASKSKPAAPILPPAVVKSTVTAPSGTWFVNVSSFSTRANAEQWAAKVQSITPNVIVSAIKRDDKTYYRVRVTGLATKSAAAEMARKLEAGLGLDSSLWVGLE